MNFRTVVQDGLIVVNTHGALPDGTPVRVSVAKPAKVTKPAGTDKKGKTPRRSVAGSAHVPGFGMWADRHDLGSSEVALTRLRAATRRRRVG